MKDSHTDLESRLHAVRAAVASVKSTVRGLSQVDAEEHLIKALRDHDAFLPKSSVRILARDLRDPRWMRSHPIKAWRRAREELTQDDADSRRFEAETRWLDERLGSFDEIVATRSTRTMDGVVHVVTIDPWSEELAARIREAAAPTGVTVLSKPQAI